MRVLLLLLIAFFTQVAALATPPPLLLGGEARIGAEPPIRVHVKLEHKAERVIGLFSTEDTVLPFNGAREGDLISGTLGGSEPVGEATLKLSGDTASGEFTLGGQDGTLMLQTTSRDAKAYLRPPQSIDLTTQQWNEDLDALVRILSTKHGDAFHHTPKPVFMREVDKVRERLASSTGIQNALHMRRLAALVGDGHTDIAFVRGRPMFPVETFWFEDGLRVVAAPASRPELLATRLVSVGGVPITTVLDRLKAYIGQAETPWGYRSAAPHLLKRADLLEAAGAARNGEAEFVFRGEDGKLHRELLKADPAATDKVRLGTGPLWQQEPAESLWTARWPDGTVYVNWRGYDDLPVRSAAILAELDAAHPRRLLVDLRDNGGGDFNVGRAFIEEIRKRPWLNRKGVLYVLIGRQTFSAAMTNAVDFRKLTEATLVGEPAGARPNGWQEVRRDFLPNSGLAVSVSTKNYSFAPGEDAVEPDLFVPPAIGDWQKERDRAVEAILAR